MLLVSFWWWNSPKNFLVSRITSPITLPWWRNILSRADFSPFLCNFSHLLLIWWLNSTGTLAITNLNIIARLIRYIRKLYIAKLMNCGILELGNQQYQTLTTTQQSLSFDIFNDILWWFHRQKGIYKYRNMIHRVAQKQRWFLTELLFVVLHLLDITNQMVIILIESTFLSRKNSIANQD